MTAYLQNQVSDEAEAVAANRHVLCVVQALHGNERPAVRHDTRETSLVQSKGVGVLS